MQMDNGSTFKSVKRAVGVESKYLSSVPHQLTNGVGIPMVQQSRDMSSHPARGDRTTYRQRLAAGTYSRAAATIKDADSGRLFVQDSPRLALQPYQPADWQR